MTGISLNTNRWPLTVRRVGGLALSLVGLAAAAGLLLSLRGASPALAGAAPVYAVIQTYDNPDPDAADEEFGSALAYLPGVDQILVGARGDQLTGTSPYGAAYLLNVTGTVVYQFRKPVPASGDYFGFSVAAALTNVVVGAPRDDRGGSPSVNYGAAYLFNAATGTLIYTFTHDSPANQDQFGYSLAIISETLVVGAPEHNTPTFDAGRVYLCGLTSGLCPDAVNNPVPGSNGHFGHSLAVLDNYIAVGAPLDGASGRVFIYAYDGVNATLAYTITGAGSGSNFGWTLAPVGNRLLIGAPADDFGANNAGAAYLYEIDGTPVYTFTNPVPHENDRFGAVVAGGADFIAIGAPNDDEGASDGGAVHLFAANDFSFVATVLTPQPVSGAQFGVALLAPGSEVLAGAFDTAGVEGAGAVHRIGIQTEWRLYLPLVLR